MSGDEQEHLSVENLSETVITCILQSSSLILLSLPTLIGSKNIFSKVPKESFLVLCRIEPVLLLFVDRQLTRQNILFHTI